MVSYFIGHKKNQTIGDIYYFKSSYFDIIQIIVLKFVCEEHEFVNILFPIFDFWIPLVKNVVFTNIPSVKGSLLRVIPQGPKDLDILLLTSQVR